MKRNGQKKHLLAFAGTISLVLCKGGKIFVDINFPTTILFPTIQFRKPILKAIIYFLPSTYLLLQKMHLKAKIKFYNLTLRFMHKITAAKKVFPKKDLLAQTTE